MDTWRDVEWLVEAPAKPAEGPLWDDARACVWWVDIMSAQLHRFDVESGVDTSHDTGEPVGAVALRNDGSLLLFVQRGLVFFDPDTGATELFAGVEAGDAATRSNDGKPGPDGAFWGGTMAVDENRGRGAFYRVDPPGTVQTLLTGVSISNGLDWLTPERLYYIDSLAGGIDVLDVDPSAGVVRSRTRFVDVDPSDGAPDGMCLDEDDHLWVAIYGAGEVRRYAPDGALVGRVVVPAPRTTCCAFGGAALTDLYITAAAGDDGRGGLLRCNVGVRGRHPYRFAG